MAISENSIKVIKYLQSLDASANVTAQDVANALGFADKRSVDGVFTSAIQRKGLGVRVEAETELPDGTHAKVKYLKLNADGMAWTPETAE